jgi:hypothetical protein
MKKTIILLAFGSLIVFGCNSSTSNNESSSAKPDTSFQAIDTTKLAAGASYYQCLMHPEVISDKPGNCPKCGDMALEKRVKQ